MNGDASEPRASWRFLALLFVAALALRLLAMVALDTPAAARGASAWSWGHEPACLATSLVEGRGYGDPWGKGSGPSSWLTPPYPALLAVLYTIFGGVSYATALALHVLQSLASALTCVLLVPLGRRFGLASAGKLAGWLFAVYPVAISNAVQIVWDTTFVALGVTAFLLVFLGAQPTSRGAILAGLAYGALLLLNPAPMALAPALIAFLWLRAGRDLRAIKLGSLFALAAFAVCLPWMLRNERVLGTFSLRPNFGVEMRIGNHDGATGRPIAFGFHPSHVASELALYRELGEAGYARENMQRARAWIESHPGPFAALTLKRVGFFWLGELPTTDVRRSDGMSPKGDPSSWVKFVTYFLAFAGAVLALFFVRMPRELAAFTIACMALYGVPYYLSHVSERYRFPIDPWLVLLDAAAVIALVERSRGARRA